MAKSKIITGLKEAVRHAREESAMTEIFVFGSNLAGRHGKGAAREALAHHGAIYGRGAGRQGRSYAIPTKGVSLGTLPLDVIANAVHTFVEYAWAHPELRFIVTPIGTGLAGYKHEDIAPMFSFAPPNCQLPEQWRTLLPEKFPRPLAADPNPHKVT